MTYHIAFVTTGDIEDIATSKRAFGMAGPLTAVGHRVSILLQETPSNRARLALEAPMAEPHWFGALSAGQENRAKRKILKEISPDIVYVGSYGIRNLVCPARPVRARYLVEHSELPSAITNRPITRRVLDFALERLTFGAFDGHVCASVYLAEFVRGKLPEARGGTVHYSPYAHTRSVMRPAGAPRRGGRGDGPKRLLYMGTLAPNYGIFHILDAMTRLRRRMAVELVVLGKGRAFDTAVARATELGLDDVVTFKGYVPEDALPGLLGEADAFVAPIFDTVQDKARCPSKLFMYVAFDRPVVTSDIGEAHQIFGPDYPYYFTPDDVPDMAAKLEVALVERADWTPSWRAADHEWQARVTAFDAWLATAFPGAPAPVSAQPKGA